MTKSPFLEKIQQQTLLVDGAMGTMLHQHGVKLGTCYDAINLSDPQLVRHIHQQYIEAGADIIETNTFGANALKLKEFGLERDVVAINEAAVEIAKRAIEGAERDIYIAGSVGPLGAYLAPLGRLKVEEAARIFRLQVSTLIYSGVDLLFFETFTDLKEIQVAVEQAREINADIPIIASVTFTRDDRTMLGESPTMVAHTLASSGANVIGVNCSGGPTQLRKILAQIRQAEPDTYRLVMPNAGWPEMSRGRIVYPATPEYFGDSVMGFEGAGACIVGGCCGTTPEHIAAMRKTLDDEQLNHAMEPITVKTRTAPDPIDVEPPTELARRLQDGKYVITVEMAPPRGAAPEKVIASAEMLKAAGATNINVSDSPMARMRMSPWALAYLMHERVGLEPVLHFPTRGRNLLRVQGDLLAAHALGIRNIFVVMGDPPQIGDYPDASNAQDIVPSGLVRLIKQHLNSGIDQAGNTINHPTNFLVGTALNLNSPNLEKEINLLKKKIDAGADFALSQPIYDPKLAENFRKQYEKTFGGLTLPIIVGLLPLYSINHAQFLHNEVPGISIPERIRERIAQADNAPDEGVKVAQELLHDLKDMTQGVYLMPPFARYNLAAEVIETLSVAVS